MTAGAPKDATHQTWGLSRAYAVPTNPRIRLTVAGFAGVVPVPYLVLIRVHPRKSAAKNSSIRGLRLTEDRQTLFREQTHKSQ